MKVKTSLLQHMLLDYAVAQCEGVGYWDKPAKFVGRYQNNASYCRFHYSWALSGEIIEREQIAIEPLYHVWLATLDLNEGDDMVEKIEGETPLIAAMRVYVASKLGDTVEIPEEVAQAYEDQIQAIKAMGTVAD